MYTRRLVAAALALGLASASQAQVVISQAFGGFGSSTPDADYVELFNQGATPVDLTGWAVQVSYNATSEPWTVVPLTSFVLNPGQYYLVAVSTDVTTLPTPDVVGTSSSSVLIFSDQGGVALTSDTTQLPLGCPTGQASLKDLLVYGGSANCFEGSGRGPVTTSSQAALRKLNGCQDTNDNTADFVAGTPVPRNTAYQWPFETFASFGNVAAIPNAVITITASGHSNACGAPANQPLTGVTVDLTSIGGPPALVMVDNGTGGDAASGDNIYTVQYTIPSGATTGGYAVTFNYSSPVGSASKLATLVVPLAGDTCAAARPIGAFPFVDTYTTANFTDDDAVSPCKSSAPNSRNGVWYSITPASTIVMRITKSSTLFNLSLWTGDCAAPTIVDCDDSNNSANFRLQAGVTYHVLSIFDATLSPTTNPTFTFDVITPPSNDLCSGAIDLNAQTLPYTDTNTQAFFDATADADNSCDGIPLVTRRGVWYTYLPAADTILKTQETGSGIIVSSSLWAGTCPGGLSMVSCNSSETASYSLAAGTRYYLLVGSNSTAQPASSTTGYNNTFSIIVPPANDLCANATDIGPLSAALNINPGPILANASADTNPCATAQFGVWYKFTAPSNGALRLNESSSIDIAWAVLPSCGAATSVLCNTTDTDVYADVAAGQTVYILLYTSSTTATATNLNFSFIPQLTNDVCSGAFDLNSQSFPFNTQPDARGSTTHDMDIGSCTSSTSSAYALWYKYTAGVTGLLTIADTSSANVDIGVWQVTSPGNPCGTIGTQIGCIADTNDAGVFSVSAGQTYLILLGGAGGASPTRPAGAYDLTFDLRQPPSNDHCSGATLISSLPYQETVQAFIADSDSQLLTGIDTGSTTCQFPAATVQFNTVWYAYTPATDETITIWEAAQKSMAIGLFSSCGSGGGTGFELACGRNDVTFDLTAGVPYLIRVGSNSATSPEGPSSIYQLNFVRTQRLTNDACANAIQLAQFPDSRFIDITKATADGPGAAGTGCNTTGATTMQRSVWYKIKTISSGTLSGGIEPDYARAGSGVAALYLSSDDTCAGINPAQVWCGSDPSTPITTPIVVNVALNANSTYYLQIGLPGTSDPSDTDAVFSIDLNYSGTVEGGNVFCVRGTTCLSVPSGTCTGTVAGTNAIVVGSCGSGGSIATGCFADYDHAGFPASIDDLFIYINAWLTGSPYTKINGNGVAGPSIDDLFIFINLWLAGCQP